MPWNNESTLHFLKLLLPHARRDKKTVFRELCKSLVIEMKEEFPDEYWTTKMLENKHNYLRAFWKAFRDAAEFSDTIYDTETKKLHMSQLHIDLFRSKYPRYGRAITSQPLLTNDTIDYNEWLEIFSTEAPTDITKAHNIENLTSIDRQRGEDNSQDLLESQETINSRNYRINALEAADTNDIDDSLENTDSAYALNEADRNDDNLATPVSQNPRVSSQRTPQRSLPRERQPNRLPERIRKRKASSLQADLALVVSEAIHDFAKQTRKHVITISTRPEGAEDLEKACKDAHKLGEEYGLSLSIQILSWLQKGPRNAVLWNAIPTKEMKRAWIASNFGRDV